MNGVIGKNHPAFVRPLKYAGFQQCMDIAVNRTHIALHPACHSRCALLASLPTQCFLQVASCVMFRPQLAEAPMTELPLHALAQFVRLAQQAAGAAGLRTLAFVVSHGWTAYVQGDRTARCVAKLARFSSSCQKARLESPSGARPPIPAARFLSRLHPADSSRSRAEASADVRLYRSVGDTTESTIDL